MLVVKFRLINIPEIKRVLCEEIENNQILKRQYFFLFLCLIWFFFNLIS